MCFSLEIDAWVKLCNDMRDAATRWQQQLGS